MKIVYIVGPSNSGKDSIFMKLRQSFGDSLKSIILYTNRPIRSGEIDGETYHFRSLEEINRMIDEGIVIEKRVYDTVHGKWIYATVDDGSFVETENYIGIGTLESLKDIQTYLGEDNIIPLFIYVKNDIRIQRALNREMNGKQDFDEMCRRWLADAADFSQEKLDSIHTFYIDNSNDIDNAMNQAIKTIKDNF